MSKSELIQEIIEQFTRCQRPARLTDWKKVGLSHSQVGMLYMLSFHRQTRVNQMADYLGVTKSAVTQLLEPLIAKGLVARTLDTKDRRIAHLALSPKGKRTLKELAKLKTAGLRSSLETFDIKDLERLQSLLSKITVA